MQNEAEHFIELIVDQTRKLLKEHWPDLESFRKNDPKIKVTLIHTLKYKPTERAVKSAVSFGRRFKESCEEAFNTDQMELSDGSGAGLGKNKK